MAERGQRRTEVGIVVGDKGDKSLRVEVRRLVKHASYGKYIYKTSRCYVHDEKNEAQVGDKVQIMETRPLSKTKRWRLVGVLEKAGLA